MRIWLPHTKNLINLCDGFLYFCCSDPTNPIIDQPYYALMHKKPNEKLMNKI